MTSHPSEIPILMYHQIRDSNRNEKLKSLCVSPKSFSMQMHLLKLLGYKGLSMRKLTPYLKGEKKGKVVGITFDDGFLNNLQYAAPILHRLEFSSTCYIISDLIGSTNIWDKELGAPQVPLMDRREINSWIDHDQDIGCHTANHLDITTCSTDILATETLQSKEKLEKEFQLKIDDFCYPFGEYKDREKKFIEKCGFKTAVTTNRSRLAESDDLLELPRVHIFRSTWIHLFLLKVISKYEDRRRK